MDFGMLYARIPEGGPVCVARATDQGQPEGAKGVVLHLLPSSQTTPLGKGMLQPLMAETATTPT